MAVAELEALLRGGRRLDAPAEGWRWFVVVHQIAPGRRERRWIQSPAMAEVDLPEELACGLYLAAVDAERTGLGYGGFYPNEVASRLDRGAQR